MSIYDKGITMTNGFSVASQKPADLKYLADTIQDRDNYVTNNLAYEGMLVFVKDDKKTYQYLANNWTEFGFNTEEFANNVYNDLDSDSTTLALSAKQGKILNFNMNSHISNMTSHITNEERDIWNAKASTALATQTSSGLMSAADKLKLDSIDAVSGSYVHPDTHPATIIEEDSTHRFVTDDEKSAWNELITKVAELEEKLKTAVFYG